MLAYEIYRNFSDMSAKQAIVYMGNFLKQKLFVPDLYGEFFKPSGFHDDTRNCIDFDFEMPKIRFSHRARKKFGNIEDITIKTQSRYGSEFETEYQKLISYKISAELKLLYFYCFFDDASMEISRYIIYDLKKLIQLKEFKSRELFVYHEDKLNTKDGGSYFNCITVQTLNDAGCLLEDYSKKHP